MTDTADQENSEEKEDQEEEPVIPNTYMLRPNFLQKMTQEQFNVLLELIEEDISKSNTNFRDSISPRERLAICLRFRQATVKETIHIVLTEELADKQYDSEECSEWCKNISSEIKKRLKDLDLDRYKFIVQVVIGEQRGEGVKMGCRCFWDSDTDNYAQDIFMNESLFCVAAAFGVFYY